MRISSKIHSQIHKILRNDQKVEDSNTPQENFKDKLFNTIKENSQTIKRIFKDDPGLVCRDFLIGNKDGIKCLIVYIEGMVDTSIINNNILKPVMEIRPSDVSGNINTDIISDSILPSGGLKKTSSFKELTSSILSGDTAFFLESSSEALIISTVGWEKRSLGEPDSEKVIRGPREAFNESLITNVSLIRKRIRSTDLRIQYKEIGRITKTNVCICYIEGIVSPRVLAEVSKRLDDIDIDGVISSGYIQEFLDDSPYVPYKTVGDTERPDTLAAKLLEGRIAILCDGTPFALTMPFIFLEYFQINEDYYDNYYFGSINRIIRWLGFFITTSVPAIYTALVTFHQEMIPTPLLLSISTARQGRPFPTVVEALLMLFVFEVLREAGTRIPTVVGQTISIVGALVIGQAAVEAKLISAPMVIIAALTGITVFLTPKMGAELIIMRMSALLGSSIIGIYGYIFTFIAFFILLSSVRSFGVPYMLGISALDYASQKDVFIRAPRPYMEKRPKLLTSWNKYRRRNRS